MRAFIGYQPAIPERVVADKSIRWPPLRQVDAVGNDATIGSQLGPACRVGARHRAVDTATAFVLGRDRIDHFKKRRGMENGEHWRGDHPRHRYRHIVQRVVEDDVEVVGIDALQAVHVGMVFGDEIQLSVS